MCREIISVSIRICIRLKQFQCICVSIRWNLNSLYLYQTTQLSFHAEGRGMLLSTQQPESMSRWCTLILLFKTVTRSPCIHRGKIQGRKYGVCVGGVGRGVISLSELSISASRYINIYIKKKITHASYLPPRHPNSWNCQNNARAWNQYTPRLLDPTPERGEGQVLRMTRRWAPSIRYFGNRSNTL